MLFDTETVLGARVRLESDTLDAFIKKHGELAEIKVDQLEQSLSVPDFVSLDKRDPSVCLYQKLLADTPIGPKMCVVVVKHLNDSGFIVTIYLTSKIRGGKIIWLR